MDEFGIVCGCRDIPKAREREKRVEKKCGFGIVMWASRIAMPRLVVVMIT
jgi:hypothetical protein